MPSVFKLANTGNRQHPTELDLKNLRKRHNNPNEGKVNQEHILRHIRNSKGTI